MILEPQDTHLHFTNDSPPTSLSHHMPSLPQISGRSMPLGLETFRERCQTASPTLQFCSKMHCTSQTWGAPLDSCKIKDWHGIVIGNICQAQAGLLHDLCSLYPCSSTMAKLYKTKEGLVEAKRDSQVEREGNGHLKKSEHDQKNVFNSYQGKVKWFLSVILADNTYEPESEILLDCLRSRVYCTRQKSVQYLYY